MQQQSPSPASLHRQVLLSQSGQIRKNNSARSLDTVANQVTCSIISACWLDKRCLILTNTECFYASYVRYRSLKLAASALKSWTCYWRLGKNANVAGWISKKELFFMILFIVFVPMFGKIGCLSGWLNVEKYLKISFLIKTNIIYTLCISF